MLNVQQWETILSDQDVTNEDDLAILQTFYAFDKHQAAASQVGQMLRYKGENKSSALNLKIGRWGAKISKKYNVNLTLRDDGGERKWDLFFDGWKENAYFIWRIKADLVKALENLNLIDEMTCLEEIVLKENIGLIEGVGKTVVVNAYERNSKARQLCILHYGLDCSVCELNFEKVYGEIGQGYMHVHHLRPLSSIGVSYEVDPIKDLRPVCPNCHAMLHKKEPPYTIHELRAVIEKK